MEETDVPVSFHHGRPHANIHTSAPTVLIGSHEPEFRRDGQRSGDDNDEKLVMKLKEESFEDD